MRTSPHDEDSSSSNPSPCHLHLFWLMFVEIQGISPPSSQVKNICTCIEKRPEWRLPDSDLTQTILCRWLCHVDLIPSHRLSTWGQFGPCTCFVSLVVLRFVNIKYQHFRMKRVRCCHFYWKIGKSGNSHPKFLQGSCGAGLDMCSSVSVDPTGQYGIFRSCFDTTGLE